MWSLFVAENVHFAVYLLGALALVAAGWLYVDIWLTYRRWRDVPAVAGWTLLVLAFVLGATKVEFSGFADSVFATVAYVWLWPVLKIGGYGLLALALVADPLQTKPAVTGLTKGKAAAALVLPGLGGQWLMLLPPLAALVTAAAYLRRATVGLERHVRPAVGVFLVLALYEAVVITGALGQATLSPTLYRLTAPFGLIWWLEHGLLLAASGLLFSWVGGYLLRRLRTQLVVALAGMTLGGFLLITVSFTGLLLWQVQEASLERLAADARTIGFSFNLKEAALRSNAELLTHDARLIDLLAAGDSGEISVFLTENLVAMRLDSLIVTDAEGRVVARGEDPRRVDDSLSNDLLVRQARTGAVASGFTASRGPLAPVVGIAAAAPIQRDGTVVGTVRAASVLDSAFLDGFKEVTSLDVALYSDGLLAASTISTGDDGSRWIGTSDTNDDLRRAAVSGVSTGTARLLSVPYLAAYLPLHNQAGQRVAWLFVGTPQVEALRAAGRAVQLTFVTAALLMIASFGPASILSARITRQVR